MKTDQLRLLWQVKHVNIKCNMFEVLIYDVVRHWYDLDLIEKICYINISHRAYTSNHEFHNCTQNQSLYKSSQYTVGAL